MDDRITTIVVASLGFVTCLCIGGVVLSSAQGRAPDPSLSNLASLAVGALIGVLVPTRISGPSNPVPPPAAK